MNLIVKFANREKAHYQDLLISGTLSDCLDSVYSYMDTFAKAGYKLILIDDIPTDQWLRQYHQPKAA